MMIIEKLLMGQVADAVEQAVVESIAEAHRNGPCDANQAVQQLSGIQHLEDARTGTAVD